MPGLFSERVEMYDVIVHKVKDIYSLVVQRSDVNVGTGTVIETYKDKSFAIEQGMQFAKYLRIAVNAGFRLAGDEIRHPYGVEIHATEALDTDVSEWEFSRKIQYLTTLIRPPEPPADPGN